MTPVDKDVVVQLEPLVQAIPELLPPVHNLKERKWQNDDKDDEKDDREDEKDDREDEKDDRDDEKDDREDEKDDREDEKHDREDDKEDEKDDREDKKNDREDEKNDEEDDKEDDKRIKSANKQTEDDDEDMMEDMPVVQRDVPIVNEETVPMMMMFNMVPSDAPEMVMDMAMPSAAEFMEAMENEGSLEPLHRSKRESAQTIFPNEFKTFHSFPTTDQPSEDEEAKSIAEDEENEENLDLHDDGPFIDSIRGEAAWTKESTVPASRTLLKLIRFRYALSTDAKRQNFKNLQGQSETVLEDLVQTSSLSGREQLGVLLNTVLKRGEIKSPRTRSRAEKVLAELQEEGSDLSRLLDGIPALKYGL